jgi:hypothetical protein
VSESEWPGRGGMRDPDQVVAVACEPAPDAASHVRALRLAQQLGVHTVVDGSGWLRADAELRYKRRQGGAIRPVLVRVGSEARDEELLADGGVFGRCQRYNAALDQLRQLGARLAGAVDERRIALAAGSTIAHAHGELSRLDALIIQRQVAYMGHGTVRLHRLVRETTFFEDHHASLAPIVLAAEQGVITPWDGDTQEMTFDD